MSANYRVRKPYNPDSKEPFPVSRSKIDLFLECQRCFYLDRQLLVGRPRSFPFNLNNAVDELLKKEFDIHREKETPHPLMSSYGIQAVPFKHEKMEEWRDALRRGIQYHDKGTNFLVRGGIDDVWQSPDGNLIIVDYKATSKKGKVSLDAPWQISYKRQIEVYQWLFRKNGFPVSDTGYFVYANGRSDEKAFDAKLEFDIDVIPYTGNDEWVDGILPKIKKCLLSEDIPPVGDGCEYCPYREAAGKSLLAKRKESQKDSGTQTSFV
jgi:hypothetical protein|tara:strand:+ start:43912 stop:44709 length:798 start_codon:yes stop_codon:yes gene_type:complete